MLSKLTGVLFFPFVVFIAYYWWEMTFVIALPLYMPLEFTVILITVIGEILIDFGGNCIG